MSQGEALAGCISCYPLILPAARARWASSCRATDARRRLVSATFPCSRILYFFSRPASADPDLSACTERGSPASSETELYISARTERGCRARDRPAGVVAVVGGLVATSASARDLARARAGLSAHARVYVASLRLEVDAACVACALCFPHRVFTDADWVSAHHINKSLIEWASVDGHTSVPTTVPTYSSSLSALLTWLSSLLSIGSSCRCLAWLSRACTCSLLTLMLTD